MESDQTSSLCRQVTLRVDVDYKHGSIDSVIVARATNVWLHTHMYNITIYYLFIYIYIHIRTYLHIHNYIHICVYVCICIYKL